MNLHLQIKAMMVPNKQIMAKPPPKEKLQKCHNNSPTKTIKHIENAFILYPFLTYGAITIPNIKMGTLSVTNCMFRTISFPKGIYENPSNSIIKTETVITFAFEVFANFTIYGVRKYRGNSIATYQAPL